TIYAQCDIIVSNSAVWNTTDVLIYLNQTSADQYKIIVKGNARWVGKDIEVEDLNGSYDSAIEIGVDNTESGFADWTNITNNDDIDFVCYHNSQVNMTNSSWDYGALEYFLVVDNCQVDLYGQNRVNRTYLRLDNNGKVVNHNGLLSRPVSSGSAYLHFYYSCVECELKCLYDCNIEGQIGTYMTASDYGNFSGFVNLSDYSFVYSDAFVYREIPFTIYQDSGTTPVSSGCNISIKRPDGITDDYALTNSEGKVNLTIFINSTFEDSNYEVYANSQWIANITPKTNSPYPKGIAIENIDACEAQQDITVTVTPSIKVIKLNSTLSNTTLLTLNVSGGQADITLSWSNFTYTTLSANRTSWTNFQGIDTIEINVTRTSQENKSRRFELNFTCLTSGCNNTTAIIETRIKSYPNLLFSNISDTPGKQNDDSSPWSDWRYVLLAYKQDDAVAASFAYQYNNSDTDAADYSVEYWCENFTRTSGDGLSNGGIYRARELEDICFSYDWIQPYLNDSCDVIIRNKIAELADQVYYDLNDGGSNPTYISTVDYHLQAYPALGIAGLLLSDYENNSLPHGSTPEDWLSVGTSDFFTNDTIHPSYNIGMFEQQVDNKGKDLLGSYITYYVDDMFFWSQVYSHHYGSMAYAYPIFRYWVMGDLYYTLPNHYSTNFITDGNLKYYNHRYFLNLLNETDRNRLYWHYQSLLSSASLPYSASRDFCESDFLTRAVAYFTYPDTSTYSQTAPTSTSFLNSNAVLQIFRKDWTENSSWLSFTTWNKTTQSNRNMGHQDQFNFEYYDKGDYLIADSGEVKHRVVGYGPTDSKGHNIIQINDSAKSTPAGIKKGSSGTLTTPAPLDLSLSNDVFEFAEADLNWNKFEDDTTLTNPVKWRRTILFPDKEYFIVLDYINNSQQQQRKIYNLFHLGSLSYDENYNDTDSFSDNTDKTINSTQTSVTYSIDITSPISKSMEIRTKFKDISGLGDINVYVNNNFVTTLSADTEYKYIRGVNYSYFATGVNNITYNTSDNVNLTVDYTTIYSVGLVDGSLEIENSAVNWKEQTYNQEINITNGSELKWNTTNINDKKIQMHLY
ncbi:MAG: hypothetical protein DRO92_03635, partial [Candidatus Altiarchaeales archaeon]